MKNIHDIKEEQQNKVSELIKNCSVFFAFSNEQFQKNKTPKQEGEKYVHLGMGGYLPKSQLDNYLNGLELIDKWYKAETKETKLRKENIIYELANHESWYTGSIDEALEALGEDYTRAEVLAVFRSEYNKQTVNL